MSNVEVAYRRVQREDLLFRLGETAFRGLCSEEVVLCELG